MLAEALEYIAVEIFFLHIRNLFGWNIVWFQRTQRIW